MENKDKKTKIILLICNVILIMTMLLVSWRYSGYIYKTQEEAKLSGFTRMIESMKQLSENYLDSERGYVKDWASYISEQKMTMEEALDFLRGVNNNKDRFVHIVDMDSFEAYSSYYPAGEEKIDTYLRYKTGGVEADMPFAGIMQNMFDGIDEEFAVLGKYRFPETKAMGVGVGSRVTLTVDGGTKDFLMLRLIPVEVLKKSWVFPMDYSSAEVGIITSSGDYVVQSQSMKSQNFPEYIRGYNFQDDYNKVEELRSQLQNTDNGILRYKNFRDTDCLWYYSSFGAGAPLYILGVVNEDELKPSMDIWYIVFVACGMLIVLVIIDGTYLMNINSRLREAAKISEQASRAKTQFLSAMSHDIRTPLNAVMGMMQIARKKAGDPERVVECMDKGIHSGRQLLTLINDVLDISKIESGKFTLNIEKVFLMDIIHDLTELLEQSTAKKAIRLEYDFAQLPHKYIRADKMRLNQIYMNLLTNAVKYTESGGTISLRLCEEDIPEDTRDTRLVFCVSDTGIGMTEEFQKQMYSTFSREIKTQVNSTQGSGLGLSIVKQMVDLMGGMIACKSVSGEGTSFTVKIDLPVEEDETEDSSDQMTVFNGADMRLLIAEDNELNWEIACELLSEFGITCDRAKNGQECVDMLTKAPDGTYSAILMDVHMPVMDGYEATRAIRSLPDEKLRKTMIIAMTADAFAENVQECLACGMNGHVAKPIDMNKLIAYLMKIGNMNREKR